MGIEQGSGPRFPSPLRSDAGLANGAFGQPVDAVGAYPHSHGFWFEA